MALRQLILNKKLEKKRSELQELIQKDTEIQERSTQAEAALEEARTDEEIKAVEDEIAEVERMQEENDGAKSKLETEMQEIEDELEELKRNEPPKPNESGERSKAQTIEFDGKRGNTGMLKRGFFKEMNLESRDAFMQREEVKEFLVRARNLIGQKRAVTGGDLVIPDVMLELLRDNLHRYSKLLKYFTVKSLKGTSRQNVTGAIPEGIWTEAVGSLNELALSFSQIELDGYKVGGFVPVANSILEDSDVNLASEILDVLGQAIGYAVDKAGLFGTGTKMPVGIATRLAETAEPAYWGTNQAAWTDLHISNIVKFDGASLTGAAFFKALILKCAVAKANYSSGVKFWAMNSTTYATIMANAIEFNAAGALVSAVNNQMPVIGGDIVILDFISDNDIIGGFGSLYLLAERAGAQLAASEHVKFTEDQTVFKGTARYDGKPVFGEGFVAINIANAAVTTTKNFAADTVNP
jgi:HK97 family phage major capsid protein